VVGFGTNDLGSGWDLEATSQRILDNLELMVTSLRKRDVQPILFNIPHVNEAAFPPDIARRAREQRIYHNAKLADFCHEKQVPLADICRHLRDEHLGDELHPNASGAQIIAREVFRILVATLRQP
jgi:lysophospholipase L1-like esterase